MIEKLVDIIVDVPQGDATDDEIRSLLLDKVLKCCEEKVTELCDKGDLEEAISLLQYMIELASDPSKFIAPVDA